jgi:putative hemolysin
MDIIILACLILINGLFVMSEIALVSARKTRLENQAEKGDRKAKIALDLSNNPEIFLSAAQIGITLIAILTGVYSGERFGKNFQPVVEKIEILRPYAATIATTIIVIIVTFLSIIFGRADTKEDWSVKGGEDSQTCCGADACVREGHPPYRVAVELCKQTFFYPV